MVDGNAVVDENVEVGAFIASLKRNNRQIRDDRAESIAESAQLMYRRAVEDMEVELKTLKRDQENMLDMSPDTAISLKIASDFNAREYVDNDLKMGIRIRELEIKLEIAKRQYKHLFGGT